MRITLDLDKVSKKKLIGTAGILKKMFKKGNVYYRLSSGKKGGHICLMNVEANMDDIIMIRHVLWDDHKRISKDITRASVGLPAQVLFDKKVKGCETKYSEKWTKVIL